jgi:CheY-like chemotaxis protein
MSKESCNSSFSPANQSPKIRQLRYAKRRGLSMVVNLIANDVVLHVTLENVSATGMGFHVPNGLPDVPACAVQVQLPDGRLLSAAVCWASKGRIGVKLLERLQNNDPLLQHDALVNPASPVRLKPAATATLARFSAASKDGSGLNILVADAFRSIGYLMKGVLEKAGNRVDMVENGLELIEATRQKIYDLVLIDSHLPLMSGDVAAAHIRKLPAPFSQCSIIAVSAETLDERHFRTQGCVVDGYLAKPIRPVRLLEQVAAIRARRELEKLDAAEVHPARASNAA